MDATKGAVSFFFISLSLIQIGCSHSSSTRGVVNQTSQTCSPTSKANSFLVKWKDSVPAEFAAFKLNETSNITRFSDVDKSVVEQEVLRRHLDEYTIAENEFILSSNDEFPSAEPTPTPCTSVNQPDAWAQNDISLTEAWNTLGVQGDDIIVAVIDSGADTNHPLLAPNLYVNAGEIAGNHIDDDGDGFIDNVNGWDFTTETGSVLGAQIKESTHGTHVSGIILGKPGNKGFVGVAPNAKLLPLKFISPSGGVVSDAIRAMDYALNKGAKVINASWGGPSCSDILKEEISKVTSHGAVFVNAAGNEGVNLVAKPEWPAAYQVPGKFTVGAYNKFQQLAFFSNYGDLVDLAAPGEAILSTVPPQKFGDAEGQLCAYNGTSMATPYVSGVAALLFSKRPSASPSEIINAINGSVIHGNFGVRTKGKLNANTAALAF